MISISPGWILGPKGPRAFEQSCRVCAFVDAVQVEAVHKVVGETGGGAMFGRFGIGIDGELAERDPDVQVGVQVADALDGQPVTEQLVVGHSKVFPGIADAGRVFADEMPKEGVFPGFVERDPVLDAVPKGLDDDLGIVGEIVGGIPTDEPAILLEQGLGHIPVEHRDKGRDVFLQERIDQALVVIQPLGVDRAFALGEHPAPGDREAVGVHLASRP